MIKRVEVIGLPGQGKSTLVAKYFKNSPRNKSSFSLIGLFYFLVYLFLWLKVLIFNKSKGMSFIKYFKIIIKRGLDSFVFSKAVVDEGSLQNFLSFFDYFDSNKKINIFLVSRLLPILAIVVQIKDREQSIKMSGLRLEKRRNLEKDVAQDISFKMKKSLDELVNCLKERGVKVVFVDSFDINGETLFNQYLNEKNN